MKYSRKMQRLHEMRVTRSIQLEPGPSPAVADKSRRDETAKPGGIEPAPAK